MSDFHVARREKQEPTAALVARVVAAFVMFFGGLVLIGAGASGERDYSPMLFVAGILVISLAFGLPMRRATER